MPLMMGSSGSETVQILSYYQGNHFGPVPAVFPEEMGNCRKKPIHLNSLAEPSQFLYNSHDMDRHSKLCPVRIFYSAAAAPGAAVSGPAAAAFLHIQKDPGGSTQG